MKALCLCLLVLGSGSRILPSEAASSSGAPFAGLGVAAVMSSIDDDTKKAFHEHVQSLLDAFYESYAEISNEAGEFCRQKRLFRAFLTSNPGGLSLAFAFIKENIISETCAYFVEKGAPWQEELNELLPALKSGITFGKGYICSASAVLLCLVPGDDPLLLPLNEVSSFFVQLMPCFIIWHKLKQSLVAAVTAIDDEDKMRLATFGNISFLASWLLDTVNASGESDWEDLLDSVFIPNALFFGREFHAFFISLADSFFSLSDKCLSFLQKSTLDGANRQTWFRSEKYACNKLIFQDKVLREKFSCLISPASFDGAIASSSDASAEPMLDIQNMLASYGLGKDYSRKDLQAVLRENTDSLGLFLDAIVVCVRTQASALALKLDDKGKKLFEDTSSGISLPCIQKEDADALADAIKLFGAIVDSTEIIPQGSPEIPFFIINFLPCVEILSELNRDVYFGQLQPKCEGEEHPLEKFDDLISALATLFQDAVSCLSDKIMQQKLAGELVAAFSNTKRVGWLFNLHDDLFLWLMQNFTELQPSCLTFLSRSIEERACVADCFFYDEDALGKYIDGLLDSDERLKKDFAHLHSSIRLKPQEDTSGGVHGEDSEGSDSSSPSPAKKQRS